MFQIGYFICRYETQFYIFVLGAINSSLFLLTLRSIAYDYKISDDINTSTHNGG